MWSGYNAGIAVYIISTLMSLSMIVFLLIKGRKTSLLFSFIWCQILIFAWSLSLTAANILYTYFSIDAEVRFFIGAISAVEMLPRDINNFVSVFFGPSWLLFCLLYTNSKIIKSRISVILLTVSAFYVYAIMLNHTIHYYRLYGTAFYTVAVYEVVCCTIGTLALIRFSVVHFGYLKKQSFLIILALLIPATVNTFRVYSIMKFQLRDGWYNNTMPASFACAMLVITIAIFRYRFLNIVPIALRKIVDNIKQPIVAVDTANAIINYNNSFGKVFSDFCQVLNNKDIIGFFKSLQPMILNPSALESVYRFIDTFNDKDLEVELFFSDPERKIYSLSIQPMIIKNNEIIGRIFTFYDITDYKVLLEELSDKNMELTAMNQELLTMNEQLKEYSDTVEELTVVKERNRFARDVHDTLGHTMTVLITLLKVSSITCETDSVKTKENIIQAMGMARAGLNELRRSISGLSPEKLEKNSLIGAINDLISDFKASGMKIDFSVSGEEAKISAECSEVLFRACQEALTNSLRHGKAENAVIILKFTEERVTLFAADDGCGCTDIKKGFGLTGMEQRVKELDGRLEYGSDGEKGFNIFVELPVSKKVQFMNPEGHNTDD